MLAASPAEALALFERTKKEDRLVQDKHHKEVAGRHFSDILGILGDELQSPSDCPERIMPLWLAHTASRLFRAQPLDRAKEWGLQFYAELKRLDGKLPFTVIHDWHANVVEPLPSSSANGEDQILGDMSSVQRHCKVCMQEL